MKKNLNIVLFSTLFNFNIKSANFFKKFAEGNMATNNSYNLDNISVEIGKFYSLKDKETLNLDFNKLIKYFFLNFTRKIKEEGGLLKMKKTTYDLKIEEKTFKIEFSKLLNDITKSKNVILDKNVNKIITDLKDKVNDNNKLITFRELCNIFNIKDCSVFLKDENIKKFGNFIKDKTLNLIDNFFSIKFNDNICTIDINTQCKDISKIIRSLCVTISNNYDNPKLPNVGYDNTFFKLHNINEYIEKYFKEYLLQEINNGSFTIKENNVDITRNLVENDKIIFLDKNFKEITDWNFDKKISVFFDFNKFFSVKDNEFHIKHQDISTRNRKIESFIKKIGIDKNELFFNIDKYKDNLKEELNFLQSETDNIITHNKINEILKGQINSILNEIKELYKDVNKTEIKYKSNDLKKELLKHIIKYKLKEEECNEIKAVIKIIKKIFSNDKISIKNKYENCKEIINKIDLSIDESDLGYSFLTAENLNKEEKIKILLTEEYKCDLEDGEIKEILKEGLTKDKELNNFLNNTISNVKKSLYDYLLKDMLVNGIEKSIKSINDCTKEDITSFKNNKQSLDNKDINNKDINNKDILSKANSDIKDYKTSIKETIYIIISTKEPLSNKDKMKDTLNDPKLKDIKDIYDKYSNIDFDNIYKNRLLELYTSEVVNLNNVLSILVNEIKNYNFKNDEILKNNNNKNKINDFKAKIDLEFKNEYNNIFKNCNIYEDIKEYKDLKKDSENKFKSSLNELYSKITNFLLSKEKDDNMNEIIDIIDKKYKEYKSNISNIKDLNDTLLNLTLNDFNNKIENLKEFSERFSNVNEDKKELIKSLINENFNLLKTDIINKKRELKVTFKIIIKNNKVLIDPYKGYFENICNKYIYGVYEYVSYSKLREDIKVNLGIKTENDFNLYSSEESTESKKNEELISSGSTIYIAFGNNFYVKSFEDLKKEKLEKKGKNEDDEEKNTDNEYEDDEEISTDYENENEDEDEVKLKTKVKKENTEDGTKIVEGGKKYYSKGYCKKKTIVE